MTQPKQAPNEVTPNQAATPPSAYSVDDEFPGYRPVSAAAVAGFLISLASVLVFISLNYAFLPVLGLIVCSLALRRIAALEQRLVGRRLALIGLTLSLSFGLVAPTMAVVNQWQIRSDARRFADEWFKAAAQRDSDFVYAVHMPASMRGGSEFTKVIKSQPHARQMMKTFLQEPAVRTLFALGPRAQARFYQRELITSVSTGEVHVVDIYAVTVDDAGDRTTFFVDVTLERAKNADQSWDWTLRSATIRTTPPPGSSG
jgi:hypothetical protein